MIDMEERGSAGPDDLVSLARDLDARCRLRGHFTLRSGQVSHEYLDKYRFESDPVLLHRVAARMRDLVPAGTELLGGLELGGVPLVTMLSFGTGIPALFVRKQAKEYGTRQIAEGADPAGRHVLLVEDVITTGGAVAAAARALRALGATVTTVVCAVDRSRPGENPLAADGIEVRSVLTMRQLDAAISALAQDSAATER
jgi:orotate phosphoribosyltransferase